MDPIGDLVILQIVSSISKHFSPVVMNTDLNEYGQE